MKCKTKIILELDIHEAKYLKKILLGISYNTYSENNEEIELGNKLYDELEKITGKE